MTPLMITAVTGDKARSGDERCMHGFEVGNARQGVQRGFGLVGQYDILLGNDWLYNYSPMIVYKKKVQLAITVDNKPFELKRVVEDSSVQLITCEELETICRKGHCFFVTQLWADPRGNSSPCS